MPRDPRAVKIVPIAHPRGCRSYVVVDPPSREACVVDPLLDRAGETLRLLADEGARLRWIVDTHSHGDHLSGAALLQQRTGAEVIVHPEAPCEYATQRPADGTRLPLGEQDLVVHHAPGITNDALVLEAPGALLTGDTLLIGTVGVRDAPGADPDRWFETFRRLFDGRPDETVIHPGHDDMGRTLSTLRQERTGNRWLREDDLEAFRGRFAADDRPRQPDAAQRLEANRRGAERPPPDLDAAAGLQDPAHATEEALRRMPRWERQPSPPPASWSGPFRATCLIAGTTVIASTVLGWVFELPWLHGLAAGVGVVLVALGLGRGGPARRPAALQPELFYQGPAKKTLG